MQKKRKRKAVIHKYWVLGFELVKMGEVVVSSEQVMESENGNTKKKMKKPASVEVVKWERFIPRMAMKVLLVEADDSTRQIIAALLRKCTYRGYLLPFPVCFFFFFNI